MGTIAAGFSMSLDGFIAGPDDDTGRIFAWMISGDADVTVSIDEQEKVISVLACIMPGES